jgi:hypothetical protein
LTLQCNGVCWKNIVTKILIHYTMHSSYGIFLLTRWLASARGRECNQFENFWRPYEFFRDFLNFHWMLLKTCELRTCVSNLGSVTSFFKAFFRCPQINCVSFGCGYLGAFRGVVIWLLVFMWRSKRQNFFSWPIKLIESFILLIDSDSIKRPQGPLMGKKMTFGSLCL